MKNTTINRIPTHAVTFIVGFALGAAVGMIVVLEGWA